MSSRNTSSDSAVSSTTFTVALAGNPNSGKTTLFNALTGLRQKVANYPGVTVEKKTGTCKLADGRAIDVIDLPGTYSLISRSLDEHLAMTVLRGIRDDTPAPDVVVVVVDASNIQRNLYLVSQLIEVGRPMVIALNMTDIAERRGTPVDAKKLEAAIGVPVIPIVGHKKQGIEDLKRAICEARIAPLPDWNFPDAMKQELVNVAGALPQAHRSAAGFDRNSAIAERLLIGDRAADIADLVDHESVSPVLMQAAARLEQLGIDPMHADVEAHYAWIETVTRNPVRDSGFQPVPDDSALGLKASVTGGVLEYARPAPLSDRVDRILLHKVWGLIIFAIAMAGLFVSVFWLADPMMGGIDSAISWLGALVASKIPDGPIHDLVTDGIFAGVGGVLVFLPQIALLFMFLAIMEDSGYLARAAFLMDRLLSKVGLHGKSFIPLLSSFACAIPAIMATRTIETRRDRLATIFIAPFMSCSARLPVYALLIGTFFTTLGPVGRGAVLLALYGLGIVAAVVTAIFFKLGAKKKYAQTFILEMPTYKIPQLSQVARQVYTNSKAFVIKAGTTIFCLSIVLWAMMYYPRLPETQISSVQARANELLRTDNTLAHQEWWRQHPRGGLSPFFEKNDPILEQELTKLEPDFVERFVAAEQLRHSIAGRIGHFMEPALKPLGFDWKMGVGLVGAFAAREVFVSTMGIVYSVGDPGDDTQSLSQQMVADRYADGKPVWTPLVAVSLLVWFVLAMQCMSTLAIVRRETGGWRWPIVMVLYMNGLAYVACVAVYQIGRIWVV